MSKKIAAVILAGGKNSRMDGNPKLLLELEGDSFFHRIKNSLLHFFDEGDIFLSVNEQGRFKELGLSLVVDEYESIGPMGGIISAFNQLDAKAILFVACDMPFVSPDTIKALIDNYERTGKMTIARTNGKIHPLLAVYPRTVVSQINAAIGRGKYRLMSIVYESDVASKVSYIDLDEADCSVMNINTPEEYKKLLG